MEKEEPISVSTEFTSFMFNELLHLSRSASQTSRNSAIMVLENTDRVVYKELNIPYMEAYILIASLDTKIEDMVHFSRKLLNWGVTYEGHYDSMGAQLRLILDLKRNVFWTVKGEVERLTGTFVEVEDLKKYRGRIIGSKFGL